MDDVTLTLAEAASVLQPPLTVRQLRMIARILNWQPAAWQQTGRAGHPVALYPAAQIMGVHRALTPWLAPPAQVSGTLLVRDASPDTTR